MSALILFDKLFSFHEETPYGRLNHGFPDASPLDFTTVDGKDVIIVPKPVVGNLPLDSFVYYIIGALVLLFCSIGIPGMIRHLKTGTIASHNGPPSYKQRRPPAPAIVNTTVRDELGRYRTDLRYVQSGNYAVPPQMLKPNLPILVVREVPESENPDNGVHFQNIGEWESLVKEKSGLDITIANLERVTQARKRLGEAGKINTRLQAALQRRARVQNSIDLCYERFKQRKETWSAEEWEVVERVMEYSDQSERSSG